MLHTVIHELMDMLHIITYNVISPFTAYSNIVPELSLYSPRNVIVLYKARKLDFYLVQRTFKNSLKTEQEREIA